MITVAKFGGSSLASAEQFKKVADIIHEDPSRRYIVPSAPGRRFDDDTKVTDLLYACYNAAEAGQDVDGPLALVRERYEEIISGLGLAVSLDEDFKTIRQNLLSHAGRSYAASRGEYLNGKLLAAFLGFEFIDAADVIRFNDADEFEDDRTNLMLAKRLKDADYAVIPGFYGSRDDGSIATFSRGGSDITGSIVARAVTADMYENWTDVSGVLIADPHIIKDTEVIDTITYKELRELAYMGAKYLVTGIAGKKGFASINIEKDRMNEEIGFCRKVLQVFEDNKLSMEHMPSGIDTMTVVVHQSEFQHREQQVISGIHRAVHPDVLELESGLALLAIVGRGMQDTRGVAGRAFTALARKNINIKMIDQGSSELNIIIAVKEKYFEEAIKALYEEFVTNCPHPRVD